MANINDARTSNSTPRHELIVILLLGCLFFLVSSYLDIHEMIFPYIEQNPELQIHELFILSFYFTIALAFFSFRRWQEAKTEISKKTELEKQLIQTAHEADHANQAKSEFLANMSHEIRTPLNSIIGFSDLLIEEVYGELNQKQTRYVSNISTSGKHLLELINQILDISKVESGQMKLNREKFCMQDMLEEIKIVLYPLAKRENIKLTFTTTTNGEDARITADRLKLKQIIFNLASNAIKFTPENGHVDIKITISEEGLTVKVADTGIGIRKSELNEIFEPFRQAGQMINKKYQGTGLGLSIAREFVELHQGSIWVESQPGIGSTFIFEIPARLQRYMSQ